MLDLMESNDPPDNVRGLYREEYERLVELGVFQDCRVELLDGQLVTMSPQGVSHASVTANLGYLLQPLVRADMRIRQHSGFEVGDRSMPEPDLAIVPHRPGHHHPREAFLIVEVADASLRNDRKIKARIYAVAGVREYWVINLAAQQIEVSTFPSLSGYGVTQVFSRGDTLRPLALPEIELPVSAILDCE